MEKREPVHPHKAGGESWGWFLASFGLTLLSGQILGRNLGRGSWVRRSGVIFTLGGLVFIIGYSAPDVLDLSTIIETADKNLVYGTMPFLNGLFALILGSYYAPYESLDQEAVQRARFVRQSAARREASQPETVWAGTGGGVLDNE